MRRSRRKNCQRSPKMRIIPFPGSREFRDSGLPREEIPLPANLPDIFSLAQPESRYRSASLFSESPLLANDTKGTLEEARRLWKAVNRPNLMVKVPATPAGIPAIGTLLEEGLNINITLLFAQSAYER